VGSRSAKSGDARLSVRFRQPICAQKLATRAAFYFQLNARAQLVAGLRKFAADAVEARLLLAAQ
jgi:hypothetical protein